MPIVQQNTDKPNEAILVSQDNPAHLAVQPFSFGGGQTVAAVFDLTPYQGRPFRLYLDEDGSYSAEMQRSHYWLLAETILPNMELENIPTGRVDEDGQEITEMVEKQLNLNGVDITVFSLPEVA